MTSDLRPPRPSILPPDPYADARRKAKREGKPFPNPARDPDAAHRLASGGMSPYAKLPQYGQRRSHDTTRRPPGDRPSGSPRESSSHQVASLLSVAVGTIRIGSRSYPPGHVFYDEALRSPRAERFTGSTWEPVNE